MYERHYYQTHTYYTLLVDDGTYEVWFHGRRIGEGVPTLMDCLNEVYGWLVNNDWFFQY